MTTENRAPEWRDAPTGPGWYWVYEWLCGGVEIVYAHDNGTILELGIDDVVEIAEFKGYKWLGPIEPPEVPDGH